MSEPKFTPGPWIAEYFYEGAWEIYGNEDRLVVSRYSHPCHDESQSNARLIAAAPDMYEVLKELEESVDYWSEYDVPVGIVDRISAAIAKAEGRNE